MPTNPSKDKQTDGEVGTLYGVTILPENMDEWIDEIYKRKVPIEEAKDVAEYLIQSERLQAQREVLEELLVCDGCGASVGSGGDCGYTLESVGRVVEQRLADLQREQG